MLTEHGVAPLHKAGNMRQFTQINKKTQSLWFHFTQIRFLILSNYI